MPITTPATAQKISEAAENSSPVGTSFLLEDGAGIGKKITWSNVLATLKALVGFPADKETRTANYTYGQLTKNILLVHNSATDKVYSISAGAVSAGVTFRAIAVAGPCTITLSATATLVLEIGEVLELIWSGSAWLRTSAPAPIADETKMRALAQTERTSNSTSYVKVKATRAPFAGPYSAVYTRKVSGGTGYVAVYVNGVFVAEQSTTATTYGAASTISAGVCPLGAEIALYYKAAAGQTISIINAEFNALPTFNFPTVLD